MNQRTVEDRLARILSHEKEAVAAYEQAFQPGTRIQNQDVWDFQEIAANHRRSVAALERQISDLGGNPQMVPTPTDRMWSGVSARDPKQKLVTDKKLLAALKQSEQAELEDCRLLLRGCDFPAEARNYLESDLIPSLLNHVTTLDQFMTRS